MISIKRLSLLTPTVNFLVFPFPVIASCNLLLVENVRNIRGLGMKAPMAVIQ